MNTQNKHAAATKPSGSRDTGGFLDSWSYKALCAALVLVLVLPGLYRLATGWFRDPAQPSSSDSTSPLPAGVADARTDGGSRASSARRDGFLPGLRPAAALSGGAGRWDRQAMDDWRRVGEAVASAGARERATAAALGRFLADGALADLRSVDRDDVAALARHLAKVIPAEELDMLLERHLGWAPAGVTKRQDPAAVLTGVYDALVGNHLEEVRPSPLLITDACEPDGRVTGQTQELSAGASRVFAVFENSRALEGLSEVLAVWRNPGDDRMVFTEFEPVRRGSAYNYVWLEVSGGWPAGRYQVELFHPEAQSVLLASEGFTVR